MWEHDWIGNWGKFFGLASIENLPCWKKTVSLRLLLNLYHTYIGPTCGLLKIEMTSADLSSMFDSGQVQVIEWNMLDKSKFLPLSVASVLSVRALVYPLTVIKTRIQVQHGSEHYKGTFRTFRSIYVNEGWRGLYRGFLVNGCQVKFRKVPKIRVRYILISLSFRFFPVSSTWQPMKKHERCCSRIFPLKITP